MASLPGFPSNLPGQAALNHLGSVIDYKLSEYSPKTILIGAVLSGVAAHKALTWYQDFSLSASKEYWTQWAARTIPFVRNEQNRQVGKILNKLIPEVFDQRWCEDPCEELPEEGKSLEEIQAMIKLRKDFGGAYKRDPSASGTEYHANDKVLEVQRMAHGEAQQMNTMHSTDARHKWTVQLEAEICRMMCNLLNGGDDAGGTFTAGGTMSIILGIRAAVAKAYYEKGITRPNIVVSSTAHVGFDKAVMLAGCDIRRVQVDVDGRVSLDAIRKMCNSNTVLIAGSACDYVTGNIDDIKAMAAFAQSKGIEFASDQCLGGATLMFAEEAFPEESFPVADFRVPGVTMVFSDLHKGLMGPKGGSVVAYKSRSLQYYQFFTHVRWSGGIYMTKGIEGSVPADISVQAWATLQHVARKGYVQAAKETIGYRKQFQSSLTSERYPKISVTGNPQLTVINIHSVDDHLNIHDLSDALGKAGFRFNCTQNHQGAQFCFTGQHSSAFVGEMIEAFAGVYDEWVKHPGKKSTGMADVYNTGAKVPEGIANNLLRFFLLMLYMTKRPSDSATLVGRVAPVSNTLLAHFLGAFSR